MTIETSRSVWVAAAAALVLMGGHAHAAPDSGTSQQAPEKRLDELPVAQNAEVRVASSPRAFVGASVNTTPAGFSITGNTLVPSDELLEPLRDLIGKATNTDEILQRLDAVQAIYGEKGYPATDIYLPDQSFPEVGGSITIGVLEARIGAVRVNYVEGAGVSRSRAEGIATTNLEVGAPLSLPAVEKAVLLLNDQPRTSATAELVPGRSVGETDVVISVKPRADEDTVVFQFGADDFGVEAAGRYRLSAAATANAPLSLGERFSFRYAVAPHYLYNVPAGESSNSVYRIAVDAPVTDWGTKVGLSVSRSEYALGREFAALRATGTALTSSVSIVHPLMRGRDINLFAFAGFDWKQLEDEIAGLNFGSREKGLQGARVGVLANYVDRAPPGDGAMGWLGIGNWAVSITATRGRLEIEDDVEAATDGDRAGGRTQGDFSKLNVEVQHVRQFDDHNSLLLSALGQRAFDNLTSAEKLDVAGPDGVRSHAIGGAVGDSGFVTTVEFRHAFEPFAEWMPPVTGRLFVDHGWVETNRRVSDRVLLGTGVGLDASYTLTAAGFGVTLGQGTNYLLNADVAWRVDGQPVGLASGLSKEIAKLSGNSIERRSPQIYASFVMRF